MTFNSEIYLNVYIWVYTVLNLVQKERIFPCFLIVFSSKGLKQCCSEAALQPKQSS